MKHIFIINTHAGGYSNVGNIRQQLSEFENLDYKVFNIRRKDGEKEIVEKILKYYENEKIRIYACGGSGTICKILNAIKDLSEIEVAFFPCGLTNDFLKTFGKENIDYFSRLENLIYGQVVEIDYLKINDGIALNSFSVGLDQVVNEKMDSYRAYSILGKRMPYVLSILNAIFITKPSEYRITLDGEIQEGAFSEVFFGNGCVIGGSIAFAAKNSVIDGKALVGLVPARRGFKAVKVLTTLGKDDEEKKSKICIRGHYKNMQIERIDGTPIVGNYDGELVPAQEKWNIEVVEKGLKFVVPREVNINE